MTPFKALILDLNGVVVSVSPQAITSLTLPQMKRGFDCPPWHAYERGAISTPECHAAVASELGVDVSLWTSALSQLSSTITPIPAMIDFVRALKTALPELLVFGFSNMSQWDHQVLEKQIEEWGIYNKFYASGHLGYRKPDAVSYETILENHGLEAGECVFVDDKLENVEGARNVGMKAVLCEHVDETIDVLRTLFDQRTG